MCLIGVKCWPVFTITTSKLDCLSHSNRQQFKLENKVQVDSNADMLNEIYLMVSKVQTVLSD